MPLVRIDLAEGKALEYGIQAGQIVYQALSEVMKARARRPLPDHYRASPVRLAGLIGIFSASIAQTTASLCRSR